MAVEIHEDQPLVEPLGLTLEATYNTWTNVWIRDYGAGINLEDLNVDNNGTVFVDEALPGDARIKTYAGAETLILTYHFANKTIKVTAGLRLPRVWSLTQRYLLAIDSGAWNQFDVWRDGVNIVSIDTQLDQPDVRWIWSAAISPNGQYIAIIAVSDLTGDQRHLLLYEGS